MTLSEAHQLLASAVDPEDIFTVNGDPAEDIKRRFRELAKVTHADLYRDKADIAAATAAFKLLNELHERAQDKLKAGTFGDRNVMDVRITTKTAEYHIQRKLTPTDLANVYTGVKVGSDAKLLFKVTRHPGDNDLADAERDALREIEKSAGDYRTTALVTNHLPALVDAFDVTQDKAKQRVNVFTALKKGYHSLAEIMDEYPAGIPVQDAVWMFRRMMGALIAVHRAGFVHGAVLPPHVQVGLMDKTEPGAHNGVLTDFNYVVRKGQPVKAMVPGYTIYYPEDVQNKAPSTFGTDLFMASKCFENLVGGQVNMPRQILGIVRACQLGLRHRLQDVQELYDDFDTVVKAVYGKPTFRLFTI